MTTSVGERVIASSRTAISLANRLGDAVATSAIAGGVAVLALGGTLVLELQAMVNGYGLRVTSDTPTYLALLRDVGLHPFQPVSPFVNTYGVETSHATPDIQVLALIWRELSPTRTLVAPVQAYHLLAAWGMIVTLLVSHSLFVWVRGLAGSRAAWISIPVLLGLFGPANVIWAGDLSFHGFLYGSFFSQTFAVALLLYALHLGAKADSRLALGAYTALVTLLLLVHPFTGVLFIFLATSRAVAAAWRGHIEWKRTPWTIGLAFVFGSAWPAYSLPAAMSVAGLSGAMIVIVAVGAPVVAYVVGPTGLHLLPALDRFRPRLAFVRIRMHATVTILALAGAAMVFLVAGWEQWLATRPITDPLQPTNHLAIYWDDRLVRWPLMLGAGLVGLAGLAYLWRTSHRLPAFWFSACFGIGLVGSVGVPIPLWNRILLFCQIPLAAGTAVVLVRSRRLTNSIVVAGFVASAAIRLLFLFYAPPTVTYYPASWIPAGYTLGQQIPTGSGLVAADPYTSYYVPAATGRQTLLISKGHVGSASELAAASAGYVLLHRLYIGDRWQEAMRTMWREGVRYVVVDHRLTLADPTLEQFSNDPMPLWLTDAQRTQLGRYFARLNLLGHVVDDTPQFVVYKLDEAKVRWETGA
jgi:hypothetical protein